MSDHWDGRGVSHTALGLPFLEMLPIDGVSVCVFDRVGQPTTLLASDSTAARLDEIQFDLAEGPVFSVFKTIAPIVIPDMLSESSTDWLFFQRTAASSGARALTVLPLLVGAVCIGAVSLHWLTSDRLSETDLLIATTAARSIAGPAAHAGSQTAHEDPAARTAGASILRPDVHQAVGMVLAQLDTTATESFARIRAYAFAEGRTLHDVAADVIGRTLDFRDL